MDKTTDTEGASTVTKLTIKNKPTITARPKENGKPTADAATHKSNGVSHPNASGSQLFSPVSGKDDDGRVAIVEYAERNLTKRVKECIDRNANVNEQNADGKCAVYWAAYNNNFDMLKDLVEAGAHLEGDTFIIPPLFYAKKNENEEMVKYIEKYTGKANDPRCT